jgi:hypothetical protein
MARNMQYCCSMTTSFVSKFLKKHNLFTHIRRDRDNFYSLSLSSVDSSQSLRVAVKLLDFRQARIGIQAETMEPAIQLTWAVPGIQVWLTRSYSRLPDVLDKLIRSVKHRYTIEYAVSAHIDRDGHEPDLVIGWNLGMDPDSWSRGESKLRRRSIWVRDALLGKQHIDTIHAEEHAVVIPLPEGPLDAVLTIDHCVRWRTIGHAVPFTSMSFKFSLPVAIGDHKDREWTGSSARGGSIDEVVKNMAAEIVRKRLQNEHTTDGKRTMYSVVQAAKGLETLGDAESIGTLIRDLADFVGYLRKPRD